jgi:glutamate synthase domain-containing protein 3
VDLESVAESQDVEVLRSLVTRHLALTGSRRAKWILENWAELLPRFIKVFPHEFKRVLGVSRSRKGEIPSRPMAPVAHAQHAPLAQVQNG